MCEQILHDQRSKTVISEEPVSATQNQGFLAAKFRQKAAFVHNSPKPFGGRASLPAKHRARTADTEARASKMGPHLIGHSFNQLTVVIINVNLDCKRAVELVRRTRKAWIVCANRHFHTIENSLVVLAVFDRHFGRL